MIFSKNTRKDAAEVDVTQLVKDTNLRHIAFIMDGNGRWAKKRSLPREAGHPVGAKTFKKVVRYCGDIGIDIVTVYAFSTENWSRPKSEVDAIMSLLDDYIKDAKNSDDENHIRYVFLGDKEKLGVALRDKCTELEELTKDNKLLLNIALNYGGRAEIVYAVNKMIAEGKTEITEEDISANIYTSHCPDPDLIVRTAGEVRTSNFLLWQSAYSEYYFTDVLWPDFDEGEVDKAVIDFSKRKRRFGGVINA